MSVTEDNDIDADDYFLPPLPRESIDITTEQKEGILKYTLVEGEKDDGPGNGDRIFIHYTASIFGGPHHGFVFDSQYERDEVFSFILDEGKVAPGLDSAAATMCRTELGGTICDRENGFPAESPASQSPLLPEDARDDPKLRVNFWVELLRWEIVDMTEPKDGGVLKKTVKLGDSGGDSPRQYGTVDVSVVGRIDGKEVERYSHSFELGMGEAIGVVEGVERALPGMKKDDVAEVVAAPAYAFGESGRSDGIPADATIIYEIELHNFDNIKEVKDMSNNERLDFCDKLKVSGSEFFKGNWYRLARKKYNKARQILEDLIELDDSQQDRREALLYPVYLNLSLVHLKMATPEECLKTASKAIALQPDSDKAYFRRGQAYFDVKEYHVARIDFVRVANLTSGKCHGAYDMIDKCDDALEMRLVQDKRMFKKMVDRPKPMKRAPRLRPPTAAVNPARGDVTKARAPSPVTIRFPKRR